jgi:hypothetical protein
MENETANRRGAGLPASLRRTHFAARTFGQNGAARLDSAQPFFMLLSFARRAVFCFCWGLFLAVPAAVFGQTNYYSTNGTEYAIVGRLPADQVFPDAAVSPKGGFVVWQDNITDGNGWGISARRADGTLSGTLSTFRVNVQGANDQERPRVAMLQNGGAVFVWQGGVEGYQHIYARFLGSSNTFLTSTDLVVSVPTNDFQVNPSVAVLDNGNVVIVWSSFNEAASNSLLDVYAKILSPDGATVRDEFLVNQFTGYNQRSPSVAALQNGGFAVAWVSEQERLVAPVLGTNSTYYSASSVPVPSVDIYARLYQDSGAPVGGEFLVNTNSYPCANPAVAAAADGSFMVAWSVRDMVTYANGWDICARSFSSNGIAGKVTLVNEHLAGNQYGPHLCAIDLDYLVVWTSLSQDGSREGVYGRFIHSDGTPVRGEFRVNTTTVSQQMQPVVASDGASQFLAVWTSYTGSPYSMDLFAQRYLNVADLLLPMNAPFVWAPFTLSNGVYQPRLQVSWPTLLGIAVSNYEVYVDGAATPMGVVTTNFWTMTAANGLTPGSTHSFTVDYVVADGHHAPQSPATSGTTWSGLSWGGIPYEWMNQFFGGYYNGSYHTNFWPAANSPVAPGGPPLLQVFQSGGNPFDASTWLVQSLIQTPQGLFLDWNAQPGRVYQVQVKTNLTAAWSNLGAPRFAAGTNDTIYVGGRVAGYYQVMLQR